METMSDNTQTTFKCHAPDAHQVFVAGTFNQWSVDTMPMKQDRKGNWSAQVVLPLGRHEYKFLVDGVWCCEPGCDGPHAGCKGCVANAFGTMNRTIAVE